jgi:hypothetical protein
MAGRSVATRLDEEGDAPPISHSRNDKCVCAGMGITKEGRINVTLHGIILLDVDHLEPIALGKAPAH